MNIYVYFMFIHVTFVLHLKAPKPCQHTVIQLVKNPSGHHGGVRFLTEVSVLDSFDLILNFTKAVVKDLVPVIRD